MYVFVSVSQIVYVLRWFTMTLILGGIHEWVRWITISIKTLIIGGSHEWVRSFVTEFAFEVVMLHAPVHDAAQTLLLGIGYLGEHREVSKLMMKKKSNLGGH